MTLAASAPHQGLIEPRPFDWPKALKEAGLVAFVMLGLTVFMVGIEVRDVSGGLALIGRFDDVAFASLFAFLGRIAITLLREGRPKPVFLICAPLALILLFILLSQDTLAFLARIGLDFGPGFAKMMLAVKVGLPFKSFIVMWIVLIMIAGFAIWALRAMTAPPMAAATSESPEESSDQMAKPLVQRITLYLGPALIVVAIAMPMLAMPFGQRLFPFMPTVDLQIMDIAVLVVTYIMLGWGLNIVVGLAGLLDLGYVAFYAVGAYSFALLATHPEAVAWSLAVFGSSFGFWICLPFAGLMSATAGVLLGFPVLRLRGDYLAIVTLGFGEMVRIILLNWYSLTKGPDGLGGIPRPSFFGYPFTASPPEGVMAFHERFGLEFESIHRVIFLYYIILVMALATNLFTMRIRKLPVGRAWEALREDEIACRSLGINPTNTKLTAFGIGAMFGGFAGSFFATRQSFISPESFTFIESAVILAIVVLGGMGSQVGVVFAAILLIGLPEIFRDLQQYRMLAFGAAMVLIMLWRPSGLLAHREPTIKLFGRQAAKRAKAAS
jgi:branched-chain amino acid transport system permease protein